MVMNFDALAPHYRWIECLFAAGQLQRCRTAQLSALADPQKILIYGEGNGRFLGALCLRYPQVQVTCVDSSMTMLGLAKDHIQKLGIDTARVQFLHADARSSKPPGSEFDVIVTHFFLDCFRKNELKDLIPVIATTGCKNCTWLLADFHASDQTTTPVISKILLGTLYRFFGWTAGLSAKRLTSPDGILREAGFELKSRRDLFFGLLHSDVWERRV